MKTIQAGSGTLEIGRQGENQAVRVMFSIRGLAEMYGPGEVQLIVQRPCDYCPYTVQLATDGDFAYWTVTSTDTANAGKGRCELHYYVGEAVVKSRTWMTHVAAAVIGPGPESVPAQRYPNSFEWGEIDESEIKTPYVWDTI